VSDLLFRPAAELAGLVRSGELTSRELVEASLARIEEVNGRLNAWVHVGADGALATAGEVKAGDDRRGHRRPSASRRFSCRSCSTRSSASVSHRR